ncbi:MFS transporter [Tsukamurella tyrosinosolvens]|uniref:MFS transporter n=1 Tax=Tsukamurella tyrosinosolvens TaxID=57704 RepID=UPI001AF7FF04|nr:MFS transporter [Tsukamurella tyrosinosolvens]QRY83134.1 MFS transporter [Tsukamurella tyrosinosolvens]
MDVRVSAPAAIAVRPRIAGAYLLLFLIGAETFLISPLLPTITAALQTDVTTAANATTAYVLVYAIASPLLGSVSDRVGRRAPLLIGAGLFLVSNLACALAPQVAVLIAARAVGGLGAALAGPSIWAYLADSSPDPESIGMLMGRGMAFFSSGQVIGIPVGAGIAAAAGWQWSFVALAAGTAVATGALASAVPRGRPAGTPPTLGEGLRVALDPRVGPILAATLVVQSFSLGAYAYAGQILHERLGWSTASLGLVGVLVGLGSVTGSLLGGRLTRSGLPGPTRTALWIAVIGAGLGAFALSHSAVPALVALFVWFVGSGGFVTAQQTALALAAGDRRASASAWNTSAMHAGTAIGVFVLGTVIAGANG